MIDQFDPQMHAQWETMFAALYHRIAPAFARRETRERSRRYLLGLLSRAERKNGWQLAEMMQESGPQGMQRLLNAAQWDAGVVRDVLRTYVVEHLGVPDGVLVVDETGFLKKGQASVGVARQYSGTAGRVENCQVGVFLAYASGHGSAFIDRDLYLPEAWSQNRPRCAAAGVPDTVSFATKTQLAQQMLARVHAANVPARWVVADTVYSGDDLRCWLDVHGYWYVLAVAATTSIWTAGQAVEARALVASVPAEGWVRLSAGTGSKGERLYDWAWFQVPYECSAGMTHWLVIRRTIAAPHDYAYYHAYAPSATLLAELVRIAGTRWVIEAGFEQTKNELGLDHDEVRRWGAWYRHITLVLLAHAYLSVLRRTLPEAAADEVRVSVPEVRRLQELVACGPTERQHRLRWSHWRRRHQATANGCHRQRRQTPYTTPPAAIPQASWLPGIRVLTDATWTVIETCLPPRPSRIGRPNSAHRHVLEGMIAVMRLGISWRSVPAAFGPWQTIYDRYKEWVKNGIWSQIVSILGIESEPVSNLKVSL